MVFFFVFPAILQAQKTDPYQFTLEQLGKIEVYTASRTLTSVEKAPSVITVVTAEEINSRGYKTLHEALGDVPGFHNLTIAAWGGLSNRGLVQDNNASYLFLVDGHSMANIMVLGFYEEYRFPQLAKIKRIEIIRGPGSTLWGSEASMGIINIITKDGNNIDDGTKRAGTFKVDYDHEFAHKQDVVDFTYGKSLGDQSDVILQANYSNNDAPWTDGHIAGPDGLYQPPGMWFRMNQWDYEPSYDLFLKYRYKEFSVEGARTDIAYWQPYLTPFDGSKKGDYYDKRNWLDVRYAPQLNDMFKLDTRIFSDDYLKGEHQWNTADNTLVYEGTGRAEAIGGETVLYYNNTSSFNALMGLHLNLTKWRHFPSQSGDEQTYATYAEGTFSGIESLNLTLGGRWERNEGGRSSEIFLPRFSAVYSLNPEWVAKYSYNTGYVRFGGVNQGGDQFFKFQGYWTRTIGPPQKSNSHDLQLSYKTDNTSLAITGYKQYVSSIAAFVGDAGPLLGVKDGYNVYYGVVSIAAFETYGAELELEQKIVDRLRIYGNAAWQHGRWDKRYPFGESGNFDIVTDSRISTYDLEPTAVPTYTWNLGINYEILRNFKSNLHYRGNAVTHVLTRTVPREFETMGAEHYVDVTLNYSANHMLDFSVYVKNLLDNNDPLPHINSGYIDQYFRRQIGLKAEVKM